jgi:hypothetical protein
MLHCNSLRGCLVQVISSIGGIRIEWPEEFKNVCKAFKNMKVSFDVPSVACALSQTMHYTYYSRLLGYTLFPSALIAIMSLPTLYAMLRQPALTHRLFGMFLRRTLNVLFLVHPIVRSARAPVAAPECLRGLRADFRSYPHGARLHGPRLRRQLPQV